MKTIFFALTLISAFAVLLVLLAGLFLMAKGGELNDKYGNKLMQARVYLQGVALVFFALTLMSDG